MNPVWSPDGTRIAYAVSSQPDWQRGTSVIAADGTPSQPLVTPEDLENSYVRGRPAWSPDGNRVAILTQDSEEARSIYVVAEDGSGLKKLADNTSMPTWSPDGSRIAFAMTTTEGGPYDLYTVHPDGSQQERMVQSSIVRHRWTDTLSWSPDGSAILFGDHVFPTDGSAGWQLPRTDEYTAWSPDGSRIAVVGGDDAVLYTIETDGTDGRVLVERHENGELIAAGGRPLPE